MNPDAFFKKSDGFGIGFYIYARHEIIGNVRRDVQRLTSVGPQTLTDILEQCPANTAPPVIRVYAKRGDPCLVRLHTLQKERNLAGDRQHKPDNTPIFDGHR